MLSPLKLYFLLSRSFTSSIDQLLAFPAIYLIFLHPLLKRCLNISVRQVVFRFNSFFYLGIPLTLIDRL